MNFEGCCKETTVHVTLISGFDSQHILYICSQDFCNTPSLRDTATRRVRIISIKHLRDGANACGFKVRIKALQKSPHIFEAFF